MSATFETSPSSNDSVLKTTTWGARFALLVLITLLVAGLCLADGNKPKLSKDLEALKGRPSGGTVDVIIQFKQTPTDAQHQKVQNKGGVLKTKLDVIKGAHYSVPVESLDALADDPDVAYISPDRRLSGSLDNTAAAVNAKAAWQSGFDGTGIGVAVIDSGIDSMSETQDLYGSNGKTRITYSQDFVGGGTDDYYGHGEHVAGIIAGSGRDSSYSWVDTRTFKGIAPNANLINLRVLDQNGQGTDSGVISAIQVAINLQNKLHIRVMNLSLGRQVFESYKQDPLCQAVEAAWKKGIVVVAAAGNYGRDNSMGTSGYATITSPGNDPYVITVGAMKTEGSPLRSNSLITSYSSKGPTLLDHVVKPDIVAPGNRVVSLRASYVNASGTMAYSGLSQMYPQNGVNTCYFQQCAYPSYMYGSSISYTFLSGTSMATPVVSGAAALLLQANGKLTPDQVKARLMKTAYKAFPSSSTTVDPVTGAIYVSQYDIFTVGAGYLDIGAALANSDLVTGNALSPTAVYDSTQNAVYLVNAEI